MFGDWEKITEGYGKMLLGYFGKTPVPPDPDVVKRAADKMGMEPTTESPLELDEANPNKGVEPAKKKLEEEGLPVTDENIFIAAACREKGIAFLKGEMKPNVRKIEKEKPAAAAPSLDKLTVTVGGEKFAVQFDGDKASVNGKSYDISVAEGGDDAPAASGGGGAGSPVPAPMPGVVFAIKKNPGEAVKEGDVVLVLEAMKMEMDIAAPADGTVAEILVKKGDQVTAGQVLATLS